MSNTTSTQQNSNPGREVQGPSVREAQRLIHADPQRGWVKLVQQYGPSFVYQGSLATCDPALVHKLLMSRAHTQRRSAVYKLMARIIPGAPGVLFQDGKEWHRHVQAVMPVFTKANVDSQASTLYEAVRTAVEQWPTDLPQQDLFRTVTELGLGAVLKVGYGLNPEEPLAARFGQELVNYKQHTMTSPARLDEFGFSWEQFRLLPAFLLDRRKLQKRVNRLRECVRQILAERAGENASENDWFSLLHKGGFSLNQITDELNHIYGAFNAIDYVLTCGLVELSKQPQWAQRIRAELDGVLGARPYPTRNDFENLPQTMHFMKEVFRCYPVAIAIMRRTGEPLKAAGKEWPVGSEVLILVQALHHHTNYWEQPDVFNPDRWNKPLREPLAYIPFLIGPRQCIGRHLAELHFVITLSTILRRFEINVLNHDVPLAPYLIPRFADPIPFRAHSRFNFIHTADH